MFASEVFEGRPGDFLLQTAAEDFRHGKAITEQVAQKVFKYLDYNSRRVVSKHQIRLLLVFYKDKHG